MANCNIYNNGLNLGGIAKACTIKNLAKRVVLV